MDASPPFTPIKHSQEEHFESLDYAVLDHDEMDFYQQQLDEELDPAHIIQTQGKTFDWPSPAVRKELASQFGMSPGQYFQLKCQRLGSIDENLTPNKRPAFYSPMEKKLLETPVHRPSNNRRPEFS